MEYTRRYLMDGLHNLRDLGGYAVPGGITRFGVLLRSDLPWHLTEDDGKRFAALEVRHTLDLRDVDESESMPDELALLRGVAYRQIAMKKVPRAVARNRPGGLSAFDEAFFWGDEYIRMLEDNHPWAKECAEFLAAAEGTVLFHCFTGKDRTGIAAMLVLLALGVSREDAIADYMLTNVYRKAIIDKFMQDKPADQYDLLLPVEGVSESMGAGSIDVLLEKYPSYEAYFEAEYGLTTARLAALRDFYLE